MKKATLKDVAKLAGVSTATVSYVVTGSRGVSDASRRKVESAMKELAYFPDQSARNLKSGKRNSIGFIIPDIANVYFSSIIEEIEGVLRQRGINLIVSNSKENPELERALIKNFSSGLVDGLIIASTLKDYDEILEQLPSGFPTVLVDRGIHHCRTDQVLTSSETAMYEGISNFISEGHRKIGFIASIENIYTTDTRIREFKDAVASNGLCETNYQIAHTDAAASTVASIASEMAADGCTAFAAGNNLITWELVSLSLKQILAGEKPYQILGYSYGQWYSWLPFLHTIDVPTRDMGRIAIRRLLDRINNNKLSPKEYILTCSYNKAIGQIPGGLS